MPLSRPPASATSIRGAPPGEAGPGDTEPGAWRRGGGRGSARGGRGGGGGAGRGRRAVFPAPPSPRPPLSPGSQRSAGGRGRTMAGSGAPRFVRPAARTAASSGRHGDRARRLGAPRGLQARPRGALPGLGALLGRGARPRQGRPGRGAGGRGGRGDASRAGRRAQRRAPLRALTWGRGGLGPRAAPLPASRAGGRGRIAQPGLLCLGCLRTHRGARAQPQPRSPPPPFLGPGRPHPYSCLDPPLGGGEGTSGAPSPRSGLDLLPRGPSAARGVAVASRGRALWTESRELWSPDPAAPPHALSGWEWWAAGRGPWAPGVREGEGAAPLLLLGDPALERAVGEPVVWRWRWEKRGQAWHQQVKLSGKPGEAGPGQRGPCARLASEGARAAQLAAEGLLGGRVKQGRCLPGFPVKRRRLSWGKARPLLARPADPDPDPRWAGDPKVGRQNGGPGRWLSHFLR